MESGIKHYNLINIDRCENLLADPFITWDPNGDDFIDLDGDLCEGVMCGMIGRDEKGKPIYASPDKVLELGIQREKGYLYFIKEAKNKICEVWRKKMTKTELKGE